MFTLGTMSVLIGSLLLLIIVELIIFDVIKQHYNPSRLKFEVLRELVLKYTIVASIVIILVYLAIVIIPVFLRMFSMRSGS